MKSGLRKVYSKASGYRWFNRIEYFAHKRSHKKGINNLYFSKNGNFGDELNEDLMSYFDLHYRHARPLGADMCCIGSNLQEFVSTSPKPIARNHTLNVLGSGFISEAKDVEHFKFNINVYVVRGELSKRRCEKIKGGAIPDVALGDPGLLIRRIFKDWKSDKQYDVGIICHVVDKNSDLIKKIELEGLRVKFIDIEQDTRSFVKEVARCGFILSSAMHGLICADSLGVPNRHIILSDKVVGGEYKFRDYYSVFSNFEYNPVYLKEQTINTDDIATYQKDYTITIDEVEQVCDSLEVAFRKFQQRSESV